MKIALDYDGTYTEDPVLWDNFIDQCYERGHDVYIVTFRDPQWPVKHKFGIPVYYTDREPKRLYMNTQGVKIDVWIDDTPEAITQRSSMLTHDNHDWYKKMPPRDP